jgi:hypothetical protein
VNITLRAAALLTAAALTLTGCQTGDKPGTIDQSPAPTSSAEPTESSTPEPKPESAPAIVINGKDKPKQEISGIVSWEIQPGKGLNATTAKKIGPAADAFIDAHLLRADRWQGKYAIKTGEMDTIKDVFTPRLYGLVKPSVDWWRANNEKYGKYEDWPKKQRSQSDAKARSIGGLLVTQILTEDGKGLVKNEMTRKVLYVTEGQIVAYVAVTGRRANNTGGRKHITAKVTMKKVDNRWLVDSVYWAIQDQPS